MKVTTEIQWTEQEHAVLDGLDRLREALEAFNRADGVYAWQQQGCAFGETLAALRASLDHFLADTGLTSRGLTASGILDRVFDNGEGVRWNIEAALKNGDRFDY